nr:MAG TPA: hypothetical protein [Caudoviricetes sp.]
MIRTIGGRMVIALRNIELQSTQRSRSPTQLVKQLTHDRHQRRVTLRPDHLVDSGETQLHRHPRGCRAKHGRVRAFPELLIPVLHQRRPFATLRKHEARIRQIRPKLPIRNLKNLIGLLPGRHRNHLRTPIPGISAKAVPASRAFAMDKNTVAQAVLPTLLQRHLPRANRVITAHNINQTVKRPPAPGTDMRTRSPLILTGPERPGDRNRRIDTSVRPRLPQHRLQRIRLGIQTNRRPAAFPVPRLPAPVGTRLLVPALSLEKPPALDARAAHTLLTRTHTATTPPVVMHPAHATRVNVTRTTVDAACAIV